MAARPFFLKVFYNVLSSCSSWLLRCSGEKIITAFALLVFCFEMVFVYTVQINQKKGNTKSALFYAILCPASVSFVCSIHEICLEGFSSVAGTFTSEDNIQSFNRFQTFLQWEINMKSSCCSKFKKCSRQIVKAQKARQI